MTLLEILKKLPLLPKVLHSILIYLQSAPVEPQKAPDSTQYEKEDLPRIRLYNEAVARIGKDLSKRAPNEQGCAESASRVIKAVYPDFPIYVRTADMMLHLVQSFDFEPTDKPVLGCIAIFPTRKGVIGHVGIWGKSHVMSNTSKTGLWEPNYKHKEWYAAAKKRGLTNFFFIPH